MRNRTLVLLVASLTVLSACRDADRSALSPLAYAPADTPYAIGMIEPFPEDVANHWTDAMNATIATYPTQLRRAARSFEGVAADAAVPRLLEAMAAEIEGKTLRAAMADVGLSPQSRFALYGLGLVPVLRWELADVEAFRAFVARMETQSGQALATAEVGDQAYWRLPIGDEPIEAVAAVVGTHLVLAVAPVQASPEVLETVFGLRAPEERLVGADALEQIIERYGYRRHLVGFIDSRRLLDALAREPDALEQAMLGALDATKPAFNDTCRSEFTALAASWPRATLGYTELARSRMTVRTVFETAPDIAADLMTLRAPMPALGALGADTLMSFGVSFNLDALPALVGRRADAVRAAPYACEALAWLNDAAAQSTQAVTNPAVYAAAPVFNGVHLIVEDLEVGPDLQPTRVDSVLVIGSRNPQTLLSMAAMALPQAGALDLSPDGSVKPLPLPPIPGATLQPRAWIAMTDALLAIGVGEGVDARLPRYLQVDPQQQPLLALRFSGRTYGIIADVMQANAARIDDAETRAQMEEQANMMRDAYASSIDQSVMRIEFTRDGIELLQDVTVR